ncbi:MAG TPA: phospholipid carrier-dependent glycosyltransferase [Candidatus Dormibacteraeota bacterium]|nr:phospholipid carrier-dependent glycosyltransferase [Candidatus Dormibacteraeota bacterium]
MSGPRAYELEEAEPSPVRRRSQYFDRWDVLIIVALTAVAFVLRFFSPILPQFFVNGTQGSIVTNCVSSTPVDAAGDPGTLCGLAYPFNRGYADNNGVVSPPNGQVFDEIYFPVDARDDIKGIEQCKPATVDCRYNYFDPEPPLAKLFIAAGELGDGWFRATFQGAAGDYVDLGFNTFGWRIAACLFGTLCIPMMYLLARRLWPYRLFAIAAATLVCFDGMFFIQSRIGMIDIFPIFFILCSYFLFLVHIQSRTVGGSLISLVALGTALGIGIASKWIVLAAYASIIVLLVGRAVLHSGGFDVGPAGHPWWSWRPRPGSAIPGGVFWPSYVSVALLALVIIPLGIYVVSWFPFFARGQFHTIADLITYQQQSFSYHATLTATHPYGSKWWSWPFLSRPVLYYAEYSGLGVDRFTGQQLWARMENLGNPWIWWTSLPCLLSLPYFIVRHRSFPATVILLGFITQYLPWAPISRVLFMYHMFGGLIFMILALAFVLAHLAQTMKPPAGKWIIAAHLGIAVLAFGYFYPLWTAVPLSQSAFAESSGTPPWGPKLWLLHCRDDIPPQQQQLFCWN